jgi:hypothetical protein
MVLKRLAGVMILASFGWAQQPTRPVLPQIAPKPPQAPRAPQGNPEALLRDVLPVQQPDSQRVQQELSNLLQRYPPNLHSVLALDPSLLTNESYLEPYPALANFLSTHPEVARNPSFYVGEPENRRDREGERIRSREEIVNDLVVFSGLSLAMCLMAWLLKTLIDYRRWNRLTNLQTDVHTKLLERFSSNEDLLSYMRTPAGSRFLESAPITLDAGPRSIAAPLGRILWTAQGGVVLVAAGIGLFLVSGRVAYDLSQPLRALGALGVALGIGLVISAIISFMISRKLGLLESAAAPRPQASPQG